MSNEEIKGAVGAFIQENQPMIQAMAELNQILRGDIEVEPPEFPEDLKEKIDGIVSRMMKGEANEH